MEDLSRRDSEIKDGYGRFNLSQGSLFQSVPFPSLHVDRLALFVFPQIHN